MQNYIKNKTVLITGASSGIGYQLALDLKAYNVNLILVARNITKLKQLKSELSFSKNTVTAYQLDVSNRKQVSSLIEQILEKQSVDILINNAGLALGLSPIDDGDIDQWETMIDTNIKGLLYVSKPIIKHMRNKATAHIVNIGSLAGKTTYPGGNVYCASKSAVHTITEGMNADLLDTNIKVTTIAPGATETQFSNVRFSGDTDKANSVYDGFTPLTAEDIAHSIIHVINTPKHVNIQHLDIMPTAQRNPYQLARKPD